MIMVSISKRGCGGRQIDSGEYKEREAVEAVRLILVSISKRGCGGRQIAFDEYKEIEAVEAVR